MSAREPQTSDLPWGGGGSVLITGGAGFIGANLAARLLDEGAEVTVLDNLSRPEVERNLTWLREHADAQGARLAIERADIRDADAVRRAVSGTTAVFHLAAQVAMTASLADPIADFDVNARGTLNVLEAVRAQPTPPPILFASTNKVYGALDGLRLRVAGSRYAPEEDDARSRGISEARQLEFHGPNGCSKGAAEQYVLDYARSHGVPAVAFRMSCVFGPRQFGSEDHGWVSHFLRRVLARRPITIYGDGRQVRDLLFIDDMIAAMRHAIARARDLAGRAFNIGGGPAQALSLIELIDAVEKITGTRPDLLFAGWRTGDQRWYVSDTRRFQAATGWRPKVEVSAGLVQQLAWLAEIERGQSGASCEEARA